MKTKLILGIIVLFGLAPMLVFGQTVIKIGAGVDSISAALAQAVSGDIIELTTSGGIYNETATTVISFPVTIRAADGLAEPPVWTCDNDSRQITLASDLTVDGIVFDGSLGAASTEDCIRLQDAVFDQNLRVNDCVFQYFDNGLDEGHAIKASSSDGMDSLIVTNSLFQHMAQEHISLKDENPAIPPGPCKYLWIENCTFWTSNNEAIYIQSHDNVPDGTPDPEFYINHVTLVGIGSKGLYPNQIDGAVIKNSIVINNSSYEYACRIYGLNSRVDGLLYWNCPSGISLQEGATEAQLTLIQAEVDPMMADVANGDFTLAENSPAVGAGVDGVTLGDPRWWPSTTSVDDANTAQTPYTYQLNQNYPNPFNPSTTINFSIAEAGKVVLTVFNTLGQEIEILVNKQMRAGNHAVTWAAANYSTGVYFYKVKVNDFESIKKMILIK